MEFGIYIYGIWYIYIWNLVYIYMEFSHGDLVIFGGKLENCEIPESFRKNPDNFDRVWNLSNDCFFK
jgi:hypothetical protein